MCPKMDRCHKTIELKTISSIFLSQSTNANGIFWTLCVWQWSWSTVKYHFSATSFMPETYIPHLYFGWFICIERQTCFVIKTNAFKIKGTIYCWCFNRFYFINNKTLVILRTEYCICHLILFSVFIYLIFCFV